VNDLVEQILPNIEDVIKGITTNKEEQDELRQNLVIKIYSKEDKLRQSIKDQKLKQWLFIVARNLYFDKKNGLSLFRKKEISTVRLLHTYDLTTEPTEHYKPNLKTLEEMLKELPEIDRMWIELWIDCDFNNSELERRTAEAGEKWKVSRRHVRIRIDSILEKWKHLDIYLS